jgi:DNA replication protein DnaC
MTDINPICEECGKIHPTTSTCAKCGVIHPARHGIWNYVHDAFCQKCFEVADKENRKNAGLVEQAQKAQFQNERISEELMAQTDYEKGRKHHAIPSAFMDSDVTRFPNSIRHLHTWTATDHRGLGIVGAVGTCKSRLAAYILNRHVAAGKLCLWLPANMVGTLATEQYQSDENGDKARQTLRRAKKCELLVIDDLGKGRSTGIVDETMFAIIDGRTQNELPTIWTANGGADFIIATFAIDMGMALARRLGTQFCDIHKA